MENKGLCSKCCEKKGIKRSKVYKQRKKKTKHILDNTEDSDSGVYTENDDNRNGENFSLNKNYKNNDYNNNLSEFKKRIFMKIKFLIFFKKLYLNNKNKSNNYISFGSLDVEINNNNNYSSLFSNKVYNKINLNNVYDYILFNRNLNRLTKEKENDIPKNNNMYKHIMFGSLKIDINRNSKIDNFNNKNNKLEKKEDSLLTSSDSYDDKRIKLDHRVNDFKNINSDLYYIFIYLVYIIFKSYDIKIVKDELHNCLGELGIQYYISQYIKISQNILNELF